MLFVYRSNSQKELLKRLCSVLADATEDILQPDWIVIGNYGISRWIQLQMTQEQGISANLNFFFPKQFLQQLFKILPEKFLSDKLLLDEEDWNWKMLELLLQFSKEKNEFSNYLQGQNSKELFFLSLRLANLFQQYALFYPNIFQNKEFFLSKFSLDRSSGKASVENIADTQKKFWLQLFEKEQYTHISHWSQNFFTASLSEIKQQIQPLKKICIFGISYLPTIYVKLFSFLSQVIDIHFFYKNSSLEYLGELLSDKGIVKKKLKFLKEEQKQKEFETIYLQTGHPVLMAFGRKELEFQYTMLEFDWDNHLIDESYPLPSSKHLLAQLQNSIIQPSLEPCWDLQQDDDSITVHSSHHKKREVEELYNYLLKILDTNSSLEPKHILVKSPQISDYVSYIEQVFSGSEYPLPYSIADYSLFDSWHSYLLELAELLQNKLELKAIWKLLECAEIRKKMQLNQEDLVQLSTILESSGIFLRKDDSAIKESFLEDDFNWQWWREKILSHCILEEIKDFEIESQSYVVVGKFLDFVSLVLKICNKEKGCFREQRLDEWQLSLQFIFAELFELEESSSVILFQLTQKLERASQYFKQKLDYQNMFCYLKQFFEMALLKTRTEKKFLDFGITFCKIQPMRSIPFRVICFLGLDDTAFPRIESYTDNHSDLNLLYALLQKNKLGFQKQIDLSNIKNEELYIFLESILCAEEYLYFSFVGWNIQDNKKTLPSLALVHLLKFLSSKLGIADYEQLPFFKQHYLYPFDSRYFKKDANNHYQSYSAYFYQLAQLEQSIPKVEKSFNAAIQLPNEPPKAIFMKDFLQFLVSPVQYYCQHILKLEKKQSLPIQKTFLKNYGNYYWDSLKFYLFAKKWLALKETKQLENKEDDLQILEQFYQDKNFPPRPLGEKAWLPHQRLLYKWLDSILELKQENLPINTSFQTELCKLNIYGGTLVYRNKLAIYSSPANFKLKRKIVFWIKHLFLCYHLAHKKPESYWIGLDKKKGLVLKRKLKFVPQAEDYLVDLITIYKKGYKQPLAFDAQIIEEFLKKKEEHFFQKISNSTKEYYYFWNLCFPNPENLTSAVLELEQKILAPIKKFLEKQ